jgi:hypothetical protein
MDQQFEAKMVAAFEDEIQKLAMCGKDHGKGGGKGMEYGKKHKEYMAKMKKTAATGADIKAKIAAPPTGDTGPPGKGLEDPRAKIKQKIMAMKGK